MDDSERIPAHQVISGDDGELLLLRRELFHPPSSELWP
jgi:hypothetical protein